MSGCFQRSLYVLTCFLTLTRAVPNPLTVQPATLLEQSLENNNVSNSALTAVIPTDFIIRPSLPLDEPVLNRRNTLLLAIHALGTLATDDFAEEQRSQTWRARQHVAIDLLGPLMVPESPITSRKYAVWGIFKAIHLMVASDDFRARNYNLLWQGTSVGFISFNNGTLSSVLGIGRETANTTTTPTIQQVDLSTPALISPQNTTTTTTTTNNQTDTDTSLSFEFYGATIGESATILTLCTGILKAAPHPKTDRVDEFFVNARTFSTFLSFMGQEEDRPGKPFMRYEYLIQLFMEMPKWVLRHGARWTEADMVFLVDEEVVGAGVLKRRVADGASVASS